MRTKIGTSAIALVLMAGYQYLIHKGIHFPDLPEKLAPVIANCNTHTGNGNTGGGGYSGDTSEVNVFAEFPGNVPYDVLPPRRDRGELN